jgi:hypothetical protein
MIVLLARRILVVLPLLGLVACSGDPGGTTAPTAKDISAAKGGTVSDEDHTAVLTIPAGALAADTQITLTVGAKTKDTATGVFAFGPAATAFETPATLSISTDGVTVPSGKKAVLAVQDGASWTEAPGSAEGSGSVEAPLSLLGTFSAIFVDEGPCDAACMAQAGAVCCTTCGCMGAVQCAPQCPTATPWDCEVGCCFDYTVLMCAP